MTRYPHMTDTLRDEIEAWLTRLLDGVQNSNSAADQIAQAAYYTAYPNKRPKHLAASHERQASGGGGFSSHALPPRNHHEEIEAAIEQHRAERREEKLIRAKFEEGCG